MALPAITIRRERATLSVKRGGTAVSIGKLPGAHIIIQRGGLPGASGTGGGGGGLTDGDKGHIIVSGGGTVLTLDPSIVTTFSLSLTNRADAAGWRTGLGLGSAATAAAASFAPAVHSHAQGEITGLAATLAAKADLVAGIIPTSQIPAQAISDFLGDANSQAAMLALVGQRGDWCIRTDINRTYFLIGDDASLLANWHFIETPGSPVASINGQTGVVVLAYGDVGAAPASHPGSGGGAHANAIAGGAAGFMTGSDKAKLDGVAAGATANSPDATLKDRANHTGTQLAATISDFTEATQDVIGAMVVAAGGTYDDPGGSVTFPGGGGGTATPTDVQIFTAGGTWTKPAGAVSVDVVCIGGGAGGGSGRKGAAATARSGGGGGAAGGWSERVIKASALGATVSITVGAGGAGGAAQATDSTNGLAGGAGGTTSFGTFVQATGGAAAAAAAAANLAAAAAGTGTFPGGAGQATSVTAGLSTNAGPTLGCAPGGGAGGGSITTANVAQNGGLGASAGPGAPSTNAARGTTVAAGGAGASATTGDSRGGAGGGGGGVNLAGASTAGGSGGFPGVGGGGGGASVDAVGASGAGGAGGDGLCIVITSF